MLIIDGVQMVPVGNIVGLQEIAKDFGVTVTTAWNWTHRYEDFPLPLAQVSGKPVWDMDDVKKWTKPAKPNSKPSSPNGVRTSRA